MQKYKKHLFASITILICLLILLTATLYFQNSSLLSLVSTETIHDNVRISEKQQVDRSIQNTSTIKTFTPGITTSPVSTLDPSESEKKIKQLLKTNQNCNLPCVMGITPGENKWPGIESEFRQMGFNWRMASPSDNNDGVTYSASIGSSFSEFTLSISPLVINDTIDGLLIGISGSKFPASIPDYDISNLIRTSGKPSRIWISSDYREKMPRPVFTFWLFYDEQGFAFRYYVIGQVQGNRIKICPRDPNRFATDPTNRLYGENIYLQNPGNSRTLEKLIMTWGEQIPNLTRNVAETSGYSFEDISGLAVENYYRIITDTKIDECFLSDKDIWGGE